MEYETYETDENYYDDFAAEDDKTKVRKQKHIQANIYTYTCNFKNSKALSSKCIFKKSFQRDNISIAHEGHSKQSRA